MQKISFMSLALVFVGTTVVQAEYTVVDTGQTICFGLNGQMTCPDETGLYYGQDAQYNGQTPAYTDTGNGTVTDRNTGLEWQKTADSNGDGTIDPSDKMSQSDGESYCQNLILAGQEDWRMPNIKALYSLIDFSGEDVSGQEAGAQPFLNTNYFDFSYGDTGAGERLIDAQWATTSNYVSTVMGNNAAMFGVNFADGRIKGYGPTNMFYIQCVRGDEDYGTNSLVNNGDNTITDQATGLMWQEKDNGTGIEWPEALTSCENATTGNHTDWRLPNAKELHSIVDYSRSPDTTDSAALAAIFSATGLTNEAGEADYGFYWTSTTHKTSTGHGGNAVYIAFGRALGYLNAQWMDVHGAGAQRSAMKEEKDISELDPSYQEAPTDQGGVAIIHGPQGDVARSLNYARCVRDTDADTSGVVSLSPIYLLLLQ
ncbi:MAG: DUF1566 domain-containing protein [Candidatus Electrothrix sp. AR5]|nr:DUF1566 domain-containing protein [Candidatus Electrothrix sp. AR5]